TRSKATSESNFMGGNEYIDSSSLRSRVGGFALSNNAKNDASFTWKADHRVFVVFLLYYLSLFAIHCLFFCIANCAPFAYIFFHIWKNFRMNSTLETSLLANSRRPTLSMFSVAT